MTTRTPTRVMAAKITKNVRSARYTASQPMTAVGIAAAAAAHSTAQIVHVSLGRPAEEASLVGPDNRVPGRQQQRPDGEGNEGNGEVSQSAQQGAAPADEQVPHQR